MIGDINDKVYQDYGKHILVPFAYRTNGERPLYASTSQWAKRRWNQTSNWEHHQPENGNFRNTNSNPKNGILATSPTKKMGKISKNDHPLSSPLVELLDATCRAALLRCSISVQIISITCRKQLGVSCNGGVPIAGWFIMENPKKMMIWEYPHFQETSSFLWDIKKAYVMYTPQNFHIDPEHGPCLLGSCLPTPGSMLILWRLYK